MQVGQRIEVEFEAADGEGGTDRWVETLTVDEVRAEGFDAVDADGLGYGFRPDESGEWVTGLWAEVGRVLGLTSVVAVA